jgi:hypothetical protein
MYHGKRQHQNSKQSFPENESTFFSGPEDTLVFRKYLDKKSPVTQGVENRIKIYSNTNPPPEVTLSSVDETSAGVKSHLINLSLTGFLALLGTAFKHI